MRARRIVISGTTVALVASMGVLLPAGIANAQHRECVAVITDGGTKEDPWGLTMTVKCGYVLDWWDRLPVGGGVADPGAGSTSGGRSGASPEPGSLNSCFEVESIIDTLKTALDRLVLQRANMEGNVQRWASDSAANAAQLAAARQRTTAAEQELQALKDAFVAAGGDLGIEFDSGGKPKGGSRFSDATNRVTAANGAESGLRANLAYTEGRLKSARESLAAVEAAGRETEQQLLEALARQRAEKCKP